MVIRQVKISEIKPYEKNAKKHDKKQIQAVAKSIKRFGWAQPLVVDKDNNLIIGHCRLLAAKTLNLIEVPVVQMDNLTPEEVNALRLADNKLNESAWDMALVKEDLKLLDEELIDLTGFSKDLIIESGEKDDDVPDLPEEPKSKLGEIYQLGRHRIMCGDSTKLEDVEKLMNGQKADMVFTDPPYGVNFTGAKFNPRAKHWDGIKNDDKQGIDLQEFIQQVFSNVSSVCVSAAPVYSFSPPMDEGYEILKGLKGAGLHIQSQIVWHKNSIALGQADYQWKHEICWYGWTEGKNHYWEGGRSLSTVWEHKKDANQSYVHPTQKPVTLSQEAIRVSCREDGKVLEPFLGSGSTLIGCEKAGRTCYGMELDERYIDVIIKRFEDFTGEKAVKLA